MFFGDKFGGLFGAPGDPIEVDAESPGVLEVLPASPSVTVGDVVLAGVVTLEALVASPTVAVRHYTGGVAARFAGADGALARLGQDLTLCRLGVAP